MTSTTSTWSGTPPGGRAAPGATIGGRYALRSAIGTGGMGTVWRASDTLLRREVAMKEVVCPPGLAPSDRDAMYERTLREARAAAALSHPSVVQVYDVVMEDGRPWIVMELLDARSLADMVLEDGPLATRAVAKIGIALLGALEVAHAAGVLHRDVKPANVLICVDGRCVLTDFGVARMPTDVQLTTPGMVLGSPHFISPERAMGGPFGPPSDLFSLGVTLYTAVEGRPPFDRGDPIETMHAVVEEPPAPPTRAGPIAGVLYGLLEKDPQRRWDVPTCRRVLRDLLAGPLANKARDHVTDPYSVVSKPRTPPPPPPAVSGSKIGGRAMVDPNESLEEAIARARAGRDRSGAAPSGAGDASPSLDLPTGAATALDLPTGAGTALDRLTGAGTALDRLTGAGTALDRPTGAGATPLDETDAAGGSVPPDQWAESATAWVRPGERPATTPGGGARAGTPPPRGGGSWTPPVPGGPGRAGARSHRRAAHSGGPGAALSGARGWPRWAKAAAGAGIAVVVLIGALVFASSGSDPTPPVGTGPSATASGPAFGVQTLRERGVEVNVPESWVRVATRNATYVEFAHPEDRERWVRINFTNDRDAKRLLTVADQRFANGYGDCPTYEHIGLTNEELGGHPGAQLEYLCTPAGKPLRHGIWRVTVVGGKAYHVYMSVWDSAYADSKPIFDEMVQSFRLVT